jgi:hypothetical protein
MHMRYHQARRCMHSIEALITSGAWMHCLQQNNDHCFAIQMWQTYATNSIIALLDTEPENPHWYNMYILAKQEMMNAPEIYTGDPQEDVYMLLNYTAWEAEVNLTLQTLLQHVRAVLRDSG